MPAPLLFALALAAGAPAAEGPPPAAPSNIVVTGRPRSVQQAARDFVHGVSKPTTAHDQLARFDDPVCVQVEGMDPPYDATVAQEVGRVALLAGARTAGAGCDPNFLILFTGDIKALMTSLYANRWGMLVGEDPHGAAMKAFSETRRPIAWWTITGASSWDGTPSSTSASPDQSPTYNNARASHTQSNVIDHVVRVVVVIDIPKIAGLNLGQVGDYVGFAVLGDIAPDARPASPSIMALFDRPVDPAARLRLTDWDKAYLKAFYHSFSDRASNIQEAQIATEMARLLASPTQKPAP